MLAPCFSKQVATARKCSSLLKKPLGKVPLTVREGTESRDVEALGHRLDVRLGIAGGEGMGEGAQVVACVALRDVGPGRAGASRQ
jgi:hypothetical protein